MNSKYNLRELTEDEIATNKNKVTTMQILDSAGYPITIKPNLSREITTESVFREDSENHQGFFFFRFDFFFFVFFCFFLCVKMVTC